MHSIYLTFFCNSYTNTNLQRPILRYDLIQPKIGWTPSIHCLRANVWVLFSKQKSHQRAHAYNCYCYCSRKGCYNAKLDRKINLSNSTKLDNDTANGKSQMWFSKLTLTLPPSLIFDVALSLMWVLGMSMKWILRFWLRLHELQHFWQSSQLFKVIFKSFWEFNWTSKIPASRHFGLVVSADCMVGSRNWNARVQPTPSKILYPTTGTKLSKISNSSCSYTCFKKSVWFN